MTIDQVINVESDEDNDPEKGSTYLNRKVTLDDDDLFGKVVPSAEEAYKFYVNYATRIGFSVRRGKLRRDAKGVIIQINFLCYKEGFQMDSDPSETKQADRLNTRTGCKAAIRFSLKDDVWKVTHFIADHNHDLAKPEEREFLRSNRKISEAHKGVIKTMANAGIRTTNTYSYLAEEVGGSQNVGFTKKDCYNFVNMEKMAVFEAGDAQSLVNLFKQKQTEDPMFFYHTQVDHENRMTNFFWTDGRSRLDYECFGDVVIFDTTYRTNRYNMICAPFVGVNNHWKNVLFGCAFLLDETTTSFIWLFETFLQSMGHAPKTIYTDQCQAMANAIKHVFPETTCHRLCLWHISLNAMRNIGSYLGIPDFKKMFNKCLYSCETEAEFQSTWDNIFETFNVEGKAYDWLMKLYSVRENWCAVFSLDNFSAKIQSSQRSESTNNVFHHISAAKMRLIEFVQHYDKQLEDTRSSELEETFRCMEGLPSTAKRSTRLLSHAGKVYTRKIYNLFSTELMASMAFMMDEVEANGTHHTFKLSEEVSGRSYTVKLNSSDDTITCSCKMFESMGLLCRHALRVLNVRNVTKIPAQHILKRWRKDAKAGIGTEEHEALLQVKDKPSVILRRNNLVRKAYDILSKGALTESGSRIAMQKLKEMEELIEKDVLKSKGYVHEEINEASNNANANNCTADERPLLDPTSVRPKGISNARLKSAAENKRKKASKGWEKPGKKVDVQKQQKEKVSNDPVSSSKKVCTETSICNQALESQASLHVPCDSVSYNLISRPLPSSIDNQDFGSRTTYRSMLPFTSMLHGDDSIIDLSQYTPTTAYAPNHAYGTFPQLSQNFNLFHDEQQLHSSSDVQQQQDTKAKTYHYL